MKLGRTSVTYEVRVLDEQAQDDNPIFTTRVTFVKVDESGRKAPIIK
jgi:acyl-CoA hydrolase